MLQLKTPTAFMRLSSPHPTMKNRPTRRVAFMQEAAAEPTRPLSIPKSTIDFDAISDVPCFIQGTRIQTAHGALPVETLKKGDAVITRDRGVQKIRWIGRKKVQTTVADAPVHIAKGAIGNDSDLLLSPDHRVLLSGWRCRKIAGADEVTAAARDLMNGRDICQTTGGPIEYFHFAFDNHEIIIANGAFAESFHPGSVSAEDVSVKTREDLVSAFPVIGADPASYGPKVRPETKPHEARMIRP